MSAYDDQVKTEFGITTEDWCRGHYSRHLKPKPATLAVHSVGIVTIVYREDPTDHSYDPVCEECYLAHLEMTWRRLTTEREQT